MSTLSAKKYLVALLITAIAFVGFVAIAEMLARELPTPYSAKLDLIKKSDYSILILGSSHTYFGIDPEFFSALTINAANVSQDYKYDLHILKTALFYNKDIKAVILPVSMFSLTSELSNGVEDWRKFNYSLYMDYHAYTSPEFFDLRNHSVFIASPNRLGLLKRSLTSLIRGNAENDWSKRGWGNSYYDPASIETLKLTGKTAAARHQRHKTISEVSIQSLKEIAHLCQTHDIRLFLVTPPAYISYRQHIETSRLIGVVSEANKLQVTYNGITYLNYLDDKRFIASDFHDADHLSHQGAEKLSRLIDYEIGQRINDYLTQKH